MRHLCGASNDKEQRYAARLLVLFVSCCAEESPLGIRLATVRSGLKIWDRTAYKLVQSGPVPVPQSGPVSLLGILLALVSCVGLGLGLGFVVGLRASVCSGPGGYFLKI